MKYVFPKYYEKLEEFNKEVYHQLIAIGAGGIKPCVSAHVGDQFGKTNSY